MSLQSFPGFLELPKELQIQIWHFAFEAADSQAWVGNFGNYTDEAKVAHLRIYYKAKLADCGVLVLSAPYSFKHLYSNRTLASDLRPFRGLMNVCRFFRLMGLEYWHAQVKGWTPGPPSFVKQLRKVYLESLAWNRRTALDMLRSILSRCATQCVWMSSEPDRKLFLPFLILISGTASVYFNSKKRHKRHLGGVVEGWCQLKLTR